VSRRGQVFGDPVKAPEFDRRGFEGWRQRWWRLTGFWPGVDRLGHLVRLEVGILEVTEVVQDWPPNIEAIRAVLPVTERNIFAYGGKIYSPSRGDLSRELIAHERVHFQQQGDLVDLWWEMFLADPEFRLTQEIPAHKAEYTEFCRNCKDRNRQVEYLRSLARRLSAPMYGGMIDFKQAMKAIRG